MQCATPLCACATLLCACATPLCACIGITVHTYSMYVCCVLSIALSYAHAHIQTHTPHAHHTHTAHTHNDTHTHTTTTTTTTAAAARTRVHIHAHANVHKHTPCLARSSTKASLWGSTYHMHTYHMHTYHMHTGLHKQSHLTQTFDTADPSQRDARHHACDKVLNAYSFPHARPIEQRRAQDEANKRIEYGTQQPT